jgi:tRNA(Phe) wybutosine-synthesizing methylase Tyw3
MFDAAKKKTLENVNSGEDYSPKGSIDGPCHALVLFLNHLSDFFTLSSCSGRISIYEDNEQDAKGVKWLLVRHCCVTTEEVWDKAAEVMRNASTNQRLVFKSEPFIMHLQCRDIKSGSHLLRLAHSCGFRESGLMTVDVKKIVLAIRTTAFGLEVPIIMNGIFLMNGIEAFKLVVSEANKRLLLNFKRVDRFLKALKVNFGWPQIKIHEMHDPHTMRWGHSATIVGRHHHFNGQTVPLTERERSPERCLSLLITGGCGSPGTSVGGAGLTVTRKIEAASIPLRAENGIREKYISSVVSFDEEHLMHAVSSAWSGGILFIGGRDSPERALEPFVRIYTCQWEEKTKKPEPLKASFLCRCSGQHPPTSRWGHSVTLIGCDSFLIVGGRNESTIFDDAFILSRDVENTAENLWVWDQVPPLSSPDATAATASCVGTKRFFHAATALQSERRREEQPGAAGAVLIHGGLTNLEVGRTDGSFLAYNIRRGRWERPVVTLEACLSEDSVSRFGHTISDIGPKTAVVIGGASFENSSVMSSSSAAQGGTSTACTLILDYYSDEQEELQIFVRSHPENFRDDKVHHSACIESSTSTLEAISSLSCKVHLIGGGALCMGLGPYYCPYHVLEISAAGGEVEAVGQSRNALGASTWMADANLSTISAGEGSNPQSPSRPKARVLLVRRRRVKAAKVFCEARGWLDKSKRISIAESGNSTVTSYNLVSPVLEDDRVQSAESLGKDAVAVEAQDIGQEEMAIPLSSKGVQELEAMLEERVRPGQAGGPGQAQGASLLEQLREQVLHSTQLRLGQQQLVLWCKNGARGSSRMEAAAGLLQAHFWKYSGQPALPIPGWSAILPSKYERIGDVLMLPEGFFSESFWDSPDLWRLLCNCFGTTRVARKARVDSGPKRESRVRLLYPRIAEGESDPKSVSGSATGPGSAGWVSVIEDKIRFSFDITRVMFCSGNCTERMRAGRMSVKDETIVDLYCGIGYYTLPWLVHGGAAHVIACEWNPNSLLALRENLAAARRTHQVAGECSIYEGDNAKSVANNGDALSAMADRVSLGLLPSSEPGWPLACRCIKHTGGMVHVHQNVEDSQRGAWISSLCASFGTLLAAEGKGHLTVECEHLEIVKSYAPRISHVVADLALK